MTDSRANETVGIVVDCCFGEQLRDLATKDMPLWVLDTAENRHFLEEARSPGERPRTAGGVTTFKASWREPPEEIFVRILPVVDMHHNELAGEPPYTAVEVYGVRATPAVQEALRDFGLTVVDESAARFRAEASRRVG